MHEEASFFQTVAGWFKDNFEWFSWIFSGVVYLLYRLHRYFTGLNRVAEEVAKLTDEEKGVMMKRDVLSTIHPVLEHIKRTDERLNRIEDSIINRSQNQRHDD